MVADEEARTACQYVVFVDERNRPLSIGSDPAEVPDYAAAATLVRGDVVQGARR